MSNVDSSFFIVGFLVYVGIMIFIGWYSSKGKTEGKNYLTGGAGLPMFLIFATMGATLIGTGSAIGATRNGFASGWFGSAYGLGACLGILLLVWASNKIKARSKGFITMSEEAQFLYDGNRNMKIVMGFMMFIVEIIWLGNHMNGGATYLAYITGLDPITARVLTVLGFGAYVVIGGYLAVVWTDLIQLIILVLGFILIAAIAIPTAGGWEAISAAYATAGKSGSLSFYGVQTVGLMAVISLVFTIFIPGLGTPTYRMRIYTSKDDKTANRALIRSALLLLGFSFIPAIIGMAAFTIASSSADPSAAAVLKTPDFAFAFVATQILGPWLGLVFMIAGLSATMSSGDSDAIAGVTILIQDIYPVFAKKALPEEKVKTWSRIGIVVTLTLAFFATLFAKDVMGYINNVIGSIIPGVSVAMFLGVFWKRVTWQGGLAAIFSGTLFGICYLSVPAFQNYIKGIFTGPAIAATIISLVFAVIVTLATKKVEVSEAERLDMVIKSRSY
ncbi:MAG: sodium:solute symporter family protein [Elusimicrobiota bacterium]|jgi:SSS family solute:Na+ symporter|nr:sodium:solute symporter family protein [Elusimicrobiota bacterium]